MMLPTIERGIQLEGAFNCRDLGGLPTNDGRRTRSGRVYRSDSLDHLTRQDLAQLQDLGIADIVDLRSDSEADEVPDALVRTSRLRRHHLAVIHTAGRERIGVPAASPSDLVERYLWYLEVGAPAIVSCIGLVADGADHGVIFHCTAGKDRTGVLTALLLEALDVKAEAIVTDYVASQVGLPQVWQRLQSHPVWGPRMAQVSDANFRVEAHTMQGFLRELRQRHGGARRWLVQAGLSSAVLPRLEQVLLTDLPS